MKAASIRVAAARAPVIDPRIVDEFAELGEKMAAWRPNVNPHAARFAELSAQILEFYENCPPQLPLIAEGIRYKLPITARQVKRWPINLMGFFRKIGRDAYLEMCQPTLADIEATIRDKEKRKLYIAEDQSGVRKLGRPVRKELCEQRAAA